MNPITAQSIRRNQRGTSLVEILAATGIVGILLGGAVLGLNATFNDLSSSSQQFAGDVRLARMDAITRGAHFRVVWSGTSYKTERLADADGDGKWTKDLSAPSQTRKLPAGIKLASSTGTQGAQFVEFDTRGMIVTPENESPDIVSVGISKAAPSSRNSGTVGIEIWPSGQIYLTVGGGGS